MDIRDFGDFVPAPTPNTIRSIFAMQQALLEKYVKIEKMIPYPVNIDAPSDQILLKDFIARVTEELGEAYESYLTLSVYKSQGTLTEERALPLLYNFNEELADAIHFMVETMIISGITPNELDKKLTEISFIEGYGMRVIGNTYDTIKGFLYEVMHFPTLEDPGIKLPIEDDNCFIQGGRVLSAQMDIHMSLLMWKVTYFLQIARNSLKNKPWKQSQMLSDHKTFTTNIIFAFITLVGLCEEVGMDEHCFYNVYHAKNQVNLFRINSKY